MRGTPTADQKLWRDVENLPAVQKVRETKRVVKLKRKSSMG